MQRTLFLLVFIIFSLTLLVEQEVLANDDAHTAAQANNPLANMTAFNIQDYYIGELTESDDSANQFWLRYAKPFSVYDTNWLMRASLPVNSYPSQSDGDTETGFGDFNVFAAYLIDTAILR
jgi:hypothetical protein